MPHLPAILFSVLFVVPQAPAEKGYHEIRRAFRQEIEKKKAYPVEGLNNMKAILYDSDRGRFHFTASQSEKDRLTSLLKDIFGVADGRSLDTIMDNLLEGRIIVAKKYRKRMTKFSGTQMHACFLIPPVPYYHRVSSMDKGEKTFAVYNATVSLREEDGNPVVIGFYQPEGTFFGLTRAANVPMKAIRRPEEHAVYFSMPTQEDMSTVLRDMRPLDPQRTGLAEVFIDYCRRHPYFAEKNEDGTFKVSDDTLRDILTMLSDISEKCALKDTRAHIRVHEDFAGFYLVEYFLTSIANIDALFPDIPVLKTLMERIAQAVSDEVSWKYLSLSMKNLRDAVVSDSEESRRSP